jgi:hypothetical protein
MPKHLLIAALLLAPTRPGRRAGFTSRVITPFSGRFPTAPAVVVCVVVFFLGAACSPASPTPVPGSVVVVGPDLVQPGTSAQYRATERLSDGSTRPVTDVRWSSSAPDVLQIDSTGLATGRAAGEAVLTAEVAARRGTQSVLVLSAGTYRLHGNILDATSGDPVPGARVEAMVDANGSQPPNAVATAGLDGRYILYGVPAVSDIRVTRDGFLPTTTRVQLASHGGRNFSIAWDPGTSDFTGAYTLTIEADDACPSAPSPLPPDLRRRTFPVEIRQAGSRLTVLVDQRFCDDRGCAFAGLAWASGATFQLTMGESRGFVEPPDLMEWIAVPGHFAPSQLLWFLGTATTNFSATGLLGRLAGTITLFPAWSQPSIASCGAGRFELRQ